jgi:acyl-coenzyme A thioesterase PaaI-like protein
MAEHAATLPRSFATVSAVRARGSDEPGGFEAELDPEWTVGGKPNGGYLLGMLARAAAATSRHPHPIAASAHYLHPPDPGPVAIHAEVLRSGRGASQVRTRLSQDGRGCVEALVTTAELVDAATSRPPYWDRGLPEAGWATFDECVRLVSPSPEGTRVAILDKIEVRLERGSDAFRRGQPRGRGELRGWLNLPGGEGFDPFSLVFAVDAFPPATFDIEPAGWVPTLELTVYVRAMPVPGPVQVLQRAHLIDAHRVDESCFVWDAGGRLVAQATQLAGIRLG